MAYKALYVNKLCCYNRRQGRGGIINKLVVQWGWAVFWFRLLIGLEFSPKLMRVWGFFVVFLLKYTLCS